MVLAELSMANSNVTNASKIVQSIGEISKDFAVNEKVIEFQNIILELQSHTTSVLSDYERMIQSNAKIKQELHSFKNMIKIKWRYELREVKRGLFVYCQRPLMRSITGFVQIASIILLIF